MMYISSSSSPHRLDQQHHTDHNQAAVNVDHERAAVHALIRHSAQDNRSQGHRQGQQAVASHVRHSEVHQPVAGHAHHAGRQKLTLQSRPEMFRRPAAQSPVDHQGWPVHSISPGQYSGTESEEPRQPVVLQLDLPAADQAISRKRHNDNGQDRLDDGFRYRCQQQESEGECRTRWKRSASRHCGPGRDASLV